MRNNLGQLQVKITDHRHTYFGTICIYIHVYVHVCYNQKCSNARKCSQKSLTRKCSQFCRWLQLILGNLIPKNVAAPENVAETDPTGNVATSPENVAAVDPTGNVATSPENVAGIKMSV